jgi:hypothetical protein
MTLSNPVQEGALASTDVAFHAKGDTPRLTAGAWALCICHFFIYLLLDVCGDDRTVVASNANFLLHVHEWLKASVHQQRLQSSSCGQLT